MTRLEEGVLLALLMLTLGVLIGFVASQAGTKHRYYLTCLEHHPVANCRELRPD